MFASLLKYFKQLIESNNKPSTTKLWYHLGNIVVTYILIHKEHTNPASITWEFLAVYSAIIGGSYFFGKKLKADTAKPEPIQKDTPAADQQSDKDQSPQ